MGWFSDDDNSSGSRGCQHKNTETFGHGSNGMSKGYRCNDCGHTVTWDVNDAGHGKVSQKEESFWPF